VAALVGTWLGHEAEYLRVWGPGQFSSALTRSAHAYFGPVGLVLLIIGMAGVQVSLRLARRLEHRVARLRGALLGSPRDVGRSDGSSGWVLGLPTLVMVLWAVQLGLYMIQENLEAHFSGLPMPGLGAVSGVHGLAPVVHLAVAGVVAAMLWLTRRRVTQLAAVAHRTETLLARRSHRYCQTAVRSRLPRACTPRQRWGMSLWVRPPPAPVTISALV
jgi:hypothetical protein